MKHVIGKVLRLNTDVKVPEALRNLPINCNEAKVDGLAWAVPYGRNGRVTDYRFLMQTAKPSPDSIRVLKVTSDGNLYYIAVNDNATPSVFADACNLCCESGTPTIAGPSSIPTPIIEEAGALQTNGNRIFKFAFPTVTGGRAVSIAGTIDGVAFSLTNGGAGYGSIAALVAALSGSSTAPINTGTWAADGTVGVTFTSSTAVNAGVAITYVVKPFCTGVLTFPLTFDRLTSNSVVSVLPAARTVANISELIATLASLGFFAEGTLTSTDGNKLGYSGSSVPGTIVNVSTTVATFSAGACVATTVPPTTV